MKTTKRIIAMTAALALSACMAVPAGMMTVSAATANTISFTGETGTHTYTAYQIFGGTIEDGVLKDISWANTSNSATLLTNLKGATATLSDNTTLGSKFTSCTDAKGVATAMAGITNDSDKDKLAAFLATQTTNLTKINATAAASVTISSDGYYLVIDEESTGNPNAKSKYLLSNVDASAGVEISVKSSAPTVEKKVKENVKDVTGKPINDSSTTEKWNDVADYNIGDSVPFKLYGTLPSTYGDYNHYYYKFTDTLADGLTAPTPANVTVKVNGTTVSNADGNMRIAVSGQTITVSFEDIKAVAPNQTDLITVEYSAVLNTNAAIGLNGNENVVKLDYSNNPNYVYNPNTTDEKENFPGDNGTPDDTSDDTNETGETPEDKVIVFTYTLEINKINSSNEKLAGAKFCVKATKGDNAGKWVKVDSNGKVSGWLSTKPTASGSEGVFISSAAANEFITISGLDDGDYEIEELAAPSGYNTLSSSETWTISAATANNQVWAGTPSTALTGLVLTKGGTSIDKKNDTTNHGVVQGEVVNTRGSELPSTGGIGTTLFILGGGCAAGIGGIYLISKKRTGKEE